MGGRMSWVAYADILAATTKQPQSGRALALAMGRCVSSVNSVLRRMHGLPPHLRLVHIAGWAEPENHRPPLALYRAGPGDDAPPPLTAKGKVSRHVELRYSSMPPRVEIVTFAVMIKALKDRPISRLSLAEVSGTCADNVGQLLNRLHRLGLIYIACWVRGNSGPPAAQFAFGAGADAPKLAPLCKRQMALRRYYSQRVAQGHLTAVQATLQQAQRRAIHTNPRANAPNQSAATALAA